METEKMKQFTNDWIDKKKEEFFDVAYYIWENAELSMEEHRSSEKLIEVLAKYGFDIEKGVAGMPTAFVATYNRGGPVIGFNAEYDGLPGISQEVGTKKKAVREGAPGHGCGHNLLGAGAVSAAVALKQLLEKEDIKATLKVFGTAGEELCIGKPFMARAGLFNDVDFFLDWHPWSYNRADYDSCNAYFSVKYHFHGRTSHGNAPWFGRSALDAAMLQAHAVELLREHIRPSECGLDAANTINYTFPNVGPETPNVVPDRTTAWYIGRFDKTELLVEVLGRINKCAEAAAMATETTFEIELISATHDKIPNKTMARIMHENLNKIGTPKFDENEQETAKQMQRELSVDISGLDEAIRPFGGGGSALCDTSEFSWHAPYATIWVTAAPAGIGWHNWVVASCAGSEIGNKAMNTAAKVIAATAIDAIMNPEIIESAKQELKERISGREYASIIPETTKPQININKEVMKKYL